MSEKIMTPEIKEASIGEFIVAEDLLNSPIKLRVVGSELQKDAIESKGGKLMDKVIFFFEDNNGNSREIGVLSFDSLVRQMNSSDPNIGDILQLETIEVAGSRYLIWKVEVVRKVSSSEASKKGPTTGGTSNNTGEVKKENLPEKTEGAVNKNNEEEEIRIEDIPF